MADEKPTPNQLGRIDREELARRHVDSAESWLRRLIHHQLFKLSGPEYITRGNWSNTLRAYVLQKKNENPERFSREIDATTFDQAIDIVCHPNYWPLHFEVALRAVYPLGREEARIFLSRLKDIRNHVAHLRGCNARQLERAICYSNDLAEAVKEFFKGLNMQRLYNVPMIVRYVDNVGNESNLDGVSTNINNRIIDWRKSGRGDLHPGDNLVAEVEVDPSFSESEYSVSWSVFGSGCSHQLGKTAHILIGNQHVGEQLEVRFEVISNLDWHRQHGKDDSLCVIFRVLPPT